MSFNPEVLKQAVVFSRKRHKLSHTPVLFNNVPIKRSFIQSI